MTHPIHGRKARDGHGRRATGSEHACPRLDEAVVWHPLERTPFASCPRRAGLLHAPARRSPEDTHPMHDVSISRFPAVRRSRPRPIWFCPSAVCSRSLHSGSRLCSKPKLQTMRKFLSQWSLMQGWGLPLPGDGCWCRCFFASSKRSPCPSCHTGHHRW